MQATSIWYGEILYISKHVFYSQNTENPCGILKNIDRKLCPFFDFLM